MAKYSTLSFTDLSKWTLITYTNGTVALVGGEIHLTTGDGAYDGTYLQTVDQYDLVDSSLIFKMHADDIGLAALEATFHQDGEYVDLTIDSSAGSPTQVVMSDTSGASVLSIDYDPVEHLWFKVSQGSDTIIHVETSPDGSTWTSQYASDTFVPFDTSKFEFGTYNFTEDVQGLLLASSSNSGAFTVSKLNVTPSIAAPVPELPGYSQTSWAWVVGPWRAGPQTELFSISSRSITIKLDEPDEASFSLLGDASDALDVHELISDLWVYRNGYPVFRGRVVGSGDSISTAYNAKFNAASYAGLLQRRIIRSTDTLWLAGRLTPIYGLKPPTSMKAHDVIWHLVDHVQHQAGMDLGIVKGDWPDLPDTTLIWAQAFFQNGDYALEHIHTIARSMKFDLWVDFQLKMNISAQRGSVSESALDFPGRLAGFERSITHDSYANLVRQSAAVEGGEVYFTAPDIITRPEGGWATTIGAPATRSAEDVLLPNQLAAIGQANFDKLSKLLPADDGPGNYSYTVTLENGVWRGPEHIWVGDTVRLVVNRGRLEINELMRVYEINISIDQNDVETVKLTLNFPKNAKDKIRNFANALWYLNKR